MTNLSDGAVCLCNCPYVSSHKYKSWHNNNHFVTLVIGSKSLYCKYSTGQKRSSSVRQ